MPQSIDAKEFTFDFIIFFLDSLMDRHTGSGIYHYRKWRRCIGLPINY